MKRVIHVPGFDAGAPPSPKQQQAALLKKKKAKAKGNKKLGEELIETETESEDTRGPRTY